MSNNEIKLKDAINNLKNKRKRNTNNGMYCNVYDYVSEMKKNEAIKKEIKLLKIEKELKSDK